MKNDEQRFPSDSARKRHYRVHQLDERRESILQAAQALFLERGLERTSMTQIARRAGITTVTLYRYFPKRHPIAFEIAARMVRRIMTVASAGIDPGTRDATAFRALCLGMIDEFDQLREAYRYIGLFDHLYASAYPSSELAVWYKARLVEAVTFLPAGEERRGRMITLLNTIMSFLEKMAARGELMGTEQEVSLDRQLDFFRKLVVGYLETAFRSA